MAADGALRFARLSEFGRSPTRLTQGSAGYDLCSAYDYTIAAWGKQLCQTDIKIELPHGCYGRLASRSGLALQHSIHVGAGVIDADYRGPIGILLLNLGPEVYCVKRGDRIAQLVLERILLPVVVECDTLTASVRGSAGFGSTGNN